MESLRRAPWPNNIRQLDATMHRLLLEADGSPILTLGHCVDELSYLATSRADATALTNDQIEEAVSRAGSISGAARRLGIDRKTLRNLRKRSD